MRADSPIGGYRVIFLISLAALLVLAGCSSAPPGQSPGTPDSETPLATNTTPTTAAPSIDYQNAPPGVNRSGVNTRPLLVAHLQQLRNHSHTIRIRTSQRRGERTLTESNIVRVDGSMASVTKSSSRRPVQSVAWTNGTTTARRFTTTGGTNATRYTFDSQPIQIQQASGETRIIGYLSATNFTAAESTERNGTTVTALRSTGTPANRTLRQLFRTTNVSGYRVQLEATPSGRITSLEVTATVGPSGRAVAWNEQYAVSAVGSTTLDQPSWIGTAKRDATQLNATVVENASYLRVDHEGGAAIDADAVVQWTTSPRQRLRNTGLGLPLESGDTIYAFVTNESLQFSRDRPDNASTAVLSSGLYLQLATGEGLPIGSVYGVPTRPPPNATRSTGGA